MKKIIYFFSIAMAMTVPTMAIANESINSEEFKYLVCSYIEDSSTLESALTKVDNIAEDLSLNDSQERDLEDLEEGTLTSEVYCQGLEF